MKGRKVRTPLEEDIVKDLYVGERVLLSGIIYTARDAAHRRMAEALKRGENLPFDLRGQVIYYAGPAPAPPGAPIGSIGPTTSGRMDRYTPMLLEMGLKGMIGKGRRDPEVIAAIRTNGAVYFGATGGAAALLAKRVKASRVIAYEDLGPEAIYELLVEDFPLLVVVDREGNDLYEIGPGQWSSSRGERIGENR
ncbi:Fe-S-containing hydro-lyase [Acetomicrobium hydrogeniformans]|uniref:Hydrolyase, tartrate beta subunit/fumarate domain protein, Fe-S type n=1 Tax=Acetomicrobium hydrogeniformans ATCC BAA-1850 TaxID=592015 RepID=A0A0T5XA31_9BACT|nr:Fe-S-containing hydro-lyase [Acetomicrobium hydrogeniformans]KRT35240.1 hydrolyase, tartrate beta subunit/fumarate domain protein, Fe-S type [Acetomicrobium hydrogeniformans ATCC BAA-1850]